MFARPRARLIALVLGCASLMGVAVPMSASVSASSANIQNQVNALFDELDRLEAQMDVASERYAEAVAMQDDLKQQIIDSEARVAQKESELSTMRRDLVKVAQQAFMNGGRSNSLTSLLTDPGGLNATVQREHLLAIALNSGANSTDEVDALVEDLELERKALKKKQKAAERAADAANAEFNSAEDLANSYQRKLNKAQADLGEALAAERARRDELALQRSASLAAKYKAEAAKYKVKAPSSRAGVAVQAALGQLGVPYQFARSSPGVAFDCSGLTKFAWAQAGVSLPHYSKAQYQMGPRIPIQAVQPGDLIFSRTPIGHVAIYIGNGKMVHAPRRGDVVKVGAVPWERVVGITRPG